MKPGLALLLRIRLAILRNRVRGIGLGGGLKLAAVAAFAAAFLIGEFALTLWLLRGLRSKEDLGVVFVGAIVGRLLALVFLVSLSMLFFSNVTASLATIYLSRDLDLLLATPVPTSRVFLLKFLETIVNSSYMVVLFITPILVAVGLTFEAGPLFYLQIPATLAAFVVPPAGAGVLITVLLMRYLPARRTHQALSAAGIVLGVTFVTGVRLLTPEKLLRPTTTEDFAAILRALTVPAARYLPSTWAADLQIAAIGGGPRDLLARLLPLALLAGAALLVTYAGAHLLYFRGVAASREGGRRRRRATPELGRAIGHGGKDLRLLGRDPTQWSQLLLLLALVVVYVFNITALPQDLLVVGGFIQVRDVIAWLNVGLAGFVLAAVSMRFVLPSISVEGGAFWLVASAPVDRGRYVLAKLRFFLPPMLLFALALVALSGRALQVDPFTETLSLATTALVTATLTALAVGIGASLPAFRMENPAQYVMTTGGILYGVLSLVYVAAVVALEAFPFWSHLRGETATAGAATWPYYAMIGGVSLLLAGVSLAWGARRLRRLEF